jgi:4-amino-4-deoxychorismate lyase
MSLLFETIKVVNKKMLNVSFHNERMNRSRYELFGCRDELNLNEIVEIPSDIAKDIYKCKVIYSDTIKDVEFRKYIPRKIDLLKLVYSDVITYSYKYLDRSVFEVLLQKNNCSENEDMLVVNYGRVTDTTYSNVVLFDGKEWHTPQFPLLKGTKRARLISDKRIFEKDILVEDLRYYEKIVLINAMLEFDPVNAELVKHFVVNEKVK